MRPAATIRVTALLVTFVYSALVYLAGLQLPGWGRFVVSSLPTCAVLIAILWDTVLWRLPVIQRLTRRPDLRGFWGVELTPHPDSHIPDGGNWGPIPGFLEVRQSYWSIHLRMYTKESQSTSTAFTWLPTFETDVDSLNFLYANTPRMSESHRSVRSDGSCSLGPASLDPKEMLGTYFTDRFTKGDLRCVYIDKSKGHASFEVATKYAEGAQQETR